MSDITKLGIGAILQTKQVRDCVHMAIIPVVAGERLAVGQRVCMKDGKAHHPLSGDEIVGIVDPFIPTNLTVLRGESFWLFMLPGSITGLKHSWSHAAFPDTSASSAAELTAAQDWLHEFARRWEMSYDNMVRYAIAGDYLCAGTDINDWGEAGDSTIRDAFWRHMETVTGMTFSEGHREGVGFRCAC